MIMVLHKSTTPCKMHHNYVLEEVCGIFYIFFAITTYVYTTVKQSICSFELRSNKGSLSPVPEGRSLDTDDTATVTSYSICVIADPTTQSPVFFYSEIHWFC